MMGLGSGYIAIALTLLLLFPFSFAAQPTIQSFSLYDVTNVSNPLTNTSYLVGSGLNKTHFLQTNYKYRIEFNVTFDAPWSADSNDSAVHSELNTAWIVNTSEIRIRNETQEFTGGSFSDGTVEWTLTDVSVGTSQNITFLYVVNTSSASLKTLSFSVNDTDDGATLATDVSTFDVKTPYLTVNLTTPPNNTIVGQNLTFRMNATITCTDGYCGTINAYARYNGSSTNPDSLLSTAEGAEPFYLISDTNPKSCGTLSNGTNCTVSWLVNTTGGLENAYLLDAYANGTMISASNSNDNLVTIGKVFDIQLGFDIIQFGALNPGDADQPAENNTVGYNITVTSNSDPVERLWIKGTNLTLTNEEEANCDSYAQYNPLIDANETIYPCRIPVNSIEWSRSLTEPLARTNLTESYTLLNTDLLSIEPNTHLTTYFWITIPYGIYAGGYNGTITFLANASE